jgi:uncharacterized membrane protein
VPVRRALPWLLGIALGAGAVHLAAVALLPRVIMGRVFAGFAEQAAPNQFVHPPLATHAARAVVRPSPDLAYSSAVFDVSAEPLHVTVPLSAPYTSLSGFADNTDNFFALNDQTAGSDPIDVVIVGPSTPRDGLAGRRVIEAPSDRGVLLVRRVVVGPDAFAAVDAVRKQARTEPLDLQKGGS